MPTLFLYLGGVFLILIIAVVFMLVKGGKRQDRDRKKQFKRMRPVGEDYERFYNEDEYTEVWHKNAK